jgi:cyclase
MPISVQQVRPNVVAAIDKSLVSNACVVLLEDGLIMIDAGMRPDIARILRNQLEMEFGRRVRYFCLTHYHADHSFSMRAFKDTTILAATTLVDNLKQSPDWTPENLAAMKKRETIGGEWVEEVELILPSLLFQERLDILDKETTVEFHHSGGHTSCSVYAYLPREKVLFAGDLIFEGRFPYAGDPTGDPEHWLAALRSWSKYDIEVVIPGHGFLGGRELIDDQLSFLEALKENTLAAISAGKTWRDVAIPVPFSGQEKGDGHVKATLDFWLSYYNKN